LEFKRKRSNWNINKQCILKRKGATGIKTSSGFKEKLEFKRKRVTGN